MSAADQPTTADAAAVHTPGPWVPNLYPQRKRGAGIIIEGPAQSIAEVHDHGDHGQAYGWQEDELAAQGIANARLIAAAPDLLVALRNFPEREKPIDEMTHEELARYATHVFYWQDEMADPAIAKATQGAEA